MQSQQYSKNKEWYQEYYLNNRKRLIEYQKKYNKKNEARLKIWRKKTKYWRIPKYKLRQEKYYREWYKKNGRKRNKKSIDGVLVWRNKNPKKFKASLLFRRYLKKNKIKKPEYCFLCKKEKKLIGHHQDYSKPLKVIWVCHSCHKKIHLKETS